MVIYPYHALRRRKEKKISYVLFLNGSSLTLWTLLGLGHDTSQIQPKITQNQIQHKTHLKKSNQPKPKLKLRSSLPWKLGWSACHRHERENEDSNLTKSNQVCDGWFKDWVFLRSI